MEPVVVRSNTAETTRSLGEALAEEFAQRDVVLLTGELGAGKTTLVQGIVVGLGSADHVQSPTFTLIREYTGRLVVAHVDVYRLERMQDVVDLGLEEIGDGEALLLIEWGDAIRDLLPSDHLVISITADDTTGMGDARRIEITGTGPSWAARWDRIRALAGSRATA
jgi:tRNA threonylcarbamoyladenosine biosynthesis protein TsaE